MDKGFGPKVLALRAEGKSYREIAKEIGCSVPTVSYHCTKMQGNEAIKRDRREMLRRTLEIPFEREALLLWLLVANVRRKDIAEALDIPYQEVLAFSRKNSLPRETYSISPYERVKRRRMHLKMLAVAYKGGRCARCGYHKSIRAMDFHHPDPEQKDFSVSQNANRAWKNIVDEIDKCVLLCSNCHREEHDRLELYAPSPPLLYETAL